MTLTRLDKWPTPYFGGKIDAIDILWQALGDPAHYVSPFCGSIIDILRRPHCANRAYHSETVNDLDGLLVNAIRSIQLNPQETAEAASWPVTEADLMARQRTAFSRHSRSKKNKGAITGVFLDPPYADTAKRSPGLYRSDNLTVAHDAREWAIAHGDDPQLRIVFAGFEGEHGDAFERAGWREVAWFKNGFLRGGYAKSSKDGHQQHRERLWLSPNCLPIEEEAKQITLF